MSRKEAHPFRIPTLGPMHNGAFLSRVTGTGATVICCSSNSGVRISWQSARMGRGGKALPCILFLAVALVISVGLAHDHMGWTGTLQTGGTPDGTAPAWFAQYAFAQSPSVVEITPADSIIDSASSVLLGALNIATFERDGHTYAAVTGFASDGVQILDMTDPNNITAVGNIANTSELRGAWGIAIFDVDGHTYAAVTAQEDDSVQILNLTDPTDITWMGGIADSADLALDRVRGITTFEWDGRLYAAAAAYSDDGVQILDLTDPNNITGVDSITDNADLVLDAPVYIATFEHDGSLYAAVTSHDGGGGVQILNLTDPNNITGVDSITDGRGSPELAGAWGITTFERDGSLYAAVAANLDDGVQILNLTDPTDITGVDRITDGRGSPELDAVWDIATFEHDGSLYAAVAANKDSGVQILNLTDPTDITGVDSITDNDSLVLNGASGITILHAGEIPYAAVASQYNHGVQILKLVSDPDAITIVDIPLIPLGPEPVISTDEQSPTNSQNVTFAVDFGKTVDPVTFNSSDISASSGDVSEPFTTDNQIFTFTVGNPDDGALAASIPARVVLYEDDNTNPASGTTSVEIDTVSPTVASIIRTNPSERITSSETLTFGVAFDEPVTGVDLESFALSLDAIGYHGWFTHTRDVQMPIPDAGTIVYDTNTITDARLISGYYYSDDGKLTITFDGTADPGLISEYYYPANERSVSDTITVTDPGRIASVSVDVNITHTYIGDLVVDLVAPDGTIMNLHNMTGFHGEDIVRTYTPDFNGTAVAGDWRLRISDNLMFDAGTLNGWTLTIVYSDTVEAVTGIINGSGAQYPVMVRAAINGTYNLDIVPDNGITDIAGNLLGGTDSTGEDQSYIVDTSFILNTSSNNLPLTDAGYDLTVHEGQRVALSGTAVDVEGDHMTYLWSHDSTALAIEIDDRLLPSTVFRAPWVDSDSVLTFTLTADDGTGTASDSMNVNIIDTSGPLRDRHDIGRISLGNTDPGTVQVSWEAPEKTPVNYRISWAKVGESYLTWSNSAGNAYPTVPSHTITGLEEGGKYKVVVRATYDGSSGDWSGEETITAARTPVPPNIPATGLPFITGTAEVGQTLVTDVSGIADADGMINSTLSYQWIFDDGTTDTEIVNATASSHVLTTGDLNNVIKVTVTFTDDAGHAESLTSAATQAVVVPPPLTAPGVPVDLVISTGLSGILNVSWQPPTSDGGSNLTGYTVQWKTASGAWTVPADVTVDTVTGTTHTITGLTDGIPYTVRIVATNSIGDGVPTSEEEATPQAPAPPRGPRDIGVITLNSTVPGTVNVSWEAPVETPAKYRVSWTVVGESYPTWTDLTGNAFPAAPLHAITGLEEGTEYKVRIRASYDGTAGSWSNEITITVTGTSILSSTHATGLPVITGTAEVGQTLTVHVSGIADADGMTNSTLSYQWISDDGTTDTEIAGATASTHVLTASDLDSTIKVRVTFTDDAGHEESLTSAATQTVIPVPAVPGVPADLRVSMDDSGVLNVSWQPPASDGGSAVTGYIIQWKAASGTWTVPANVTEDTVTGTTHTITGLTDGTPYTVRVIATNDVGDGTPSTEKTMTPQPPAPPRGPREIGRVAVSSTVPGIMEILWEAPRETPVNYRVSWAGVGESYPTWTDLTGNAFPTAPLHTITGLEEGTEYKMRMRANYDGTTGGWSAEVTVTIAETSSDTTSPRILSITTPDPTDADTSDLTSTFNVTFSEPVLNVDAADFVLNGTGSGNITNTISASQTQYNVNVSVDAEGTYNLGVVPNSGITDLDGNPLADVDPPVNESLHITIAYVIPVLAAIPDLTVNELSVLTFVAGVINGDLLAGSLTYGLDGEPDGAVINPDTGRFEWTPTEIQNGGHIITVTVSDSSNFTGSQDVAVTVNEVNTAPVLDQISGHAVDILSTLTFVANATDDDRHPGAVAETVVENLRIPWSIDWTPDGTALFTERGGNLRVIRDGALASDPLLSLNVSSGEGGLLGITVDPDFEDNNYIYLYYSIRDADNALTNKVVRYYFANGTATQDSVLIDGIPGAPYHDGGRIQFGPDGNLYITTGDAVVPALAQDRNSLAGKILRIDRNGAVPADNPFPNSPVWSMGHRNPQGIDWDASGNLVATEHGPSGGLYGSAHDEINVITKGANYGWPDIIGGESAEGMQVPILHTGDDTWAPSGSEFYDGDRIPGWTGKYFVAALRGEHMHMVDLDLQNNTVTSHEKLFHNEFGRLRDVQTGPDGFLYLLTSNQDGRGSPVSSDDRILRIVPAPDADRSRPANILTYGLDGAPEGASIDPASGTFAWTPAGDHKSGIITFNLTVSDGQGGTDAQPVAVRVNGAPDAPQNLRATPAHSSITLAWDRPDDDSITGYRILSGSPADLPQLSVLVSDTNSTDAFYNVKDLEPFTVYVFGVVAINEYGASDRSDLVNASPVSISSSDYFITTWRTTNPYPQVTIPAGDASGSYTVIWKDGIESVNVTGTQTHTYGAPGIHKVRIYGDFSGIRLAGDPNAPKLNAITQWGTLQWESMNSAFNGATNMVYLATDTPDLSGVTDMSHMFAGASSFDGNLSAWDVSTVTKMDGVFAGASSFDGDISAWDVSRITGATGMFYNASSFDGDISAWNVSSVAKMDGMFGKASSFDGDISAWDVSSVTDMYRMFDGASSFDGDISAWNVSSVAKMDGMFNKASSFNGNLSAWDVSLVTDMYRMFSRASSFNGNLSAWDVSSVTGMNGMFDGASSFDGDISAWDVSSVTGMNGMFDGASSFDGDISAWDVSSVTDMSGMFYGASSFNGNLSAWDVSSATDMIYMFADAAAFDQNLGNWYVVSDSTIIRSADVPGMVGAITTQNNHLSGHNPIYGIGSGGDSDRFMIVNDTLHLQSIDPTDNSYTVNVTASGNGTFGTHNWRMLDVEVVPDNSPPTVEAGSDLILTEGSTATLNGTATDIDGDPLTYLWSHDPPAPAIWLANLTASSTAFTAPMVSSNTTFTFTLTAHDGSTTGSDTVTVAILDVRTDERPDDIGTFRNNTVVLEPDLPRDPHDIGRMTLSSAAPDVIDVSWEAPGEDPVDYRIMWAPTGEPFKTWTDLSGNAFPIEPSQSITGLEEDEAYKVKVRARYGGTAGDWTGEAVITTSTTIVQIDTNTPATGLPVITGTAEVGQTLAADVSGITDADGMTNATLSYQWISGDGADDTEIANATASTYVLTADDLDSTIKVTITFTDDAGHEESVTSAVTQTVAPIPAAPNTPATGLPVITGTAEVGQTLAADVSGITDADGMTNATLSYQWISVNGTTDAEIANATASTYVLAADDLDSTIKITITFTDDAGHEESVTSAVTLAVTPITTTVVETSRQFITTWQTTLAGESITIPVGGATGIYTIDWGDGNTDYDVSGDRRHTYDDAGTYTVRISGDFTRIYLNGDQPNAGKLKSIEQWGDVRWESMESAFQGASSMVYRADDAPDLSDVASMRYMFEDAVSFNADLSTWDVSSVTDMFGMFWGASSFNGDLSTWDISSVTDMKRMFSDAVSFNADLSTWDVSSVTDMTRMFDHASRFSGDLSDWDVSGVTTMDYMFHDAFAFNGNISTWDVSGVTDMRAMFRNAFYFNADLSMWDVSGVTDMRAMFRGAVEFNDNISAWNVSSATKMRNMFSGADAFDQNLGSWYIVLDDTIIDGGNTAGTIGRITAQNPFLDGQNPTYRIGSGANSEHFEIDGTALKLKKTAQNNLANGSYTVTITSTGEFGTGNSRTYEIVVAYT